MHAVFSSVTLSKIYGEVRLVGFYTESGLF